MYEPSEDEYAYILKDIKFSTESKFINDLYDKKLIKVFLVVECSDTVFRKKIEVDKISSTIRLYKNDFTEKVDISMFAVATKNFTLFYEVDEIIKILNLKLKRRYLMCNDGLMLDLSMMKQRII